jgi:RNA polymerase sigma-70 factor, ECF subfamily
MTAAAEGSESREPVALLHLAKAGDVVAFEQLIVLHERRVFLTALRLLRRREDAEDAAQEVFLRLHKHLRRFDDTREFPPWLYRVTVNVCRDVARSRQRGWALEAGEPRHVEDPTAEYERREQKRIVEEALGRLPEKERAAIVLRDLEGLPTKEVARILGSTAATVRSQVSSARLKIRGFADRFRRRQA